jgi:tetratricopeptide (TPR) repeat protein
MKIFLSYGHDDNTPMVERIRKDLEARGHEVWIDTSQIKAGDDWRRSIAQGVQDAQKTLAMLSRHSVREPGVCRDELAISLANGGDQSLVTVLLESEKEVSPPLLVSHILWVDFSQWKEKSKQGGAEYEAWYARGLERIVTILESQKDYEDEITELRRLLHISPTQLTWVQHMAWLLRRGFVGREWLEEEITTWLQEKISFEQQRETGRNIFCLTAGPGVGKSALAAHFASLQRLSVVGLHFCNKIDSVQAILLSLAFQMGTRLPDYRRFLLRVLKNAAPEKALYALPPDELFDFLLGKAAYTPMGEDEARYALLLDGLDESDGTIARLLAQKADDLPRWLRIIVTSRPHDAHVRQHLESMNPRFLDVGDERNLTDIQRWIDQWLTSKNIEERKKSLCASALLEASGGVFLYLIAFRDMVESDPVLLDNPEKYPRGLSSLYASYLQRHMPDAKAYKKELRPFLRLLCAARRPLPLALAEGLLRGKNPNLKHGALQESILPRLGSLVDVRDEAVSPFHKSFTDWLQSDAGAYRVNALDGHAVLAESMYRKIMEGVEPDLDRLDAYGRRELPWHLLAWLNNGEEYAAMLQRVGLDRPDAQAEAEEALHDLGLTQPVWERLRKVFQAEINRLKDNLRETARVDWMVCHVRLSGVLYGPEHPDVAEACIYLARILLALGEYRTALPLNERALSIYEKALGSDHLDVATACKNLASTLYALGEYKAARPLHERALGIAEKTLGPEHPKVASQCSDLASTLKDLGEYRAALSLNERALNIKEKTLAPEHPDVARACIGLAATLKALGEYTAALPLCERAVGIMEKALGPDHPHVATTCGYLARTLHTLGEYTAALSLQERALSIMEKALVPDHPEIAKACNDSVSILYALGEYKAALPLCERALSIQQARLGSEHPNTQATRKRLRVLVVRGALKNPWKTIQAWISTRRRAPAGY